ncbi:molybdenum cofactor synthesis protein-like protein [Amylocarpus encephaloides]|uniref:Adenylyltransferase and sulfurtransferase uba4 n=1 Tax=Amylocarpus encephaloides TaxID=45428 RepID=A0A9P8C726_9HELO|nr:molybdenum cofactor synthesis protein-like protein [Amylocarpus encephaloides]
MESANASAAALRAKIAATEERLKLLKAQLANIEEKEAEEVEESPVTRKWPLLPDEYKRYGRQMIVPSVGIQGQLRLKDASVLIVGAGGLGCPSSAYLAGAGVGTIGIVDGDIVETSNLHRQILHNSSTVGMKKVDSIVSYLKSLNPHLKYITHPTHLTPQNAAEIVSQYELVLDCTDHPTSRYLISDTCILLQKPLVSASALRRDGQLIVLNSPPLPAGDAKGGPCYRCVFPKPPPTDSVVSCGDGGILGPVVGVMGVLQALEGIKLIVEGRLKEEQEVDGRGNTMLLFSASGSPQFRSLKMRARSSKCVACSGNAELTLEKLPGMDYAVFCGIASPIGILKPEERIEAKEYLELEQDSEKTHVLLDVREKVQFDICSLENSINIPSSSFQGTRSSSLQEGKPSWLPETVRADASIYVICRLGNDSQIVTQKLKEAGLDNNGKRAIKDIRGGLKAWKEQVNPSWPEY